MTDDIYVGKDLGWREIATDETAIRQYIDVADDANDWYLQDSPFGGPVLPATFLHFQAFNHNPGWFPSDIYGTLFARERWQWCQPIMAGERIRSHAWISEIQRKGERWHITCDVDVFNSRDEIALRTRTTQTFLVDQGYRGMVRSKSSGARKERRSDEPNVPEELQSLASLKKFVTVEMCARFFSGTKNYHTDVKESEKMGFDDIVVGGPMSVCYIGQMLTRNLGPNLFVGSQLDIRFVDILWPNNEIEVRGVRTSEPVAELDRQRYPLRLQICDPTGRVTVVAEGSYVSRA